MNECIDETADSGDPYAVGQTANAEGSADAPVVALAIGLGVIAGIFSTILGAIFSWAGIRLVSLMVFSQSGPPESFITDFALPGCIGFTLGVTAGFRVGRKVYAKFDRLREVTRRRAELAANIAIRSEDLRNRQRPGQK